MSKFSKMFSEDGAISEKKLPGRISKAVKGLNISKVEDLGDGAFEIEIKDKEIHKYDMEKIMKSGAFETLQIGSSGKLMISFL